MATGKIWQTHQLRVVVEISLFVGVWDTFQVSTAVYTCAATYTLKKSNIRQASWLENFKKDVMVGEHDMTVSTWLPSLF